MCNRVRDRLRRFPVNYRDRALNRSEDRKDAFGTPPGRASHHPADPFCLFGDFTGARHFPGCTFSIQNKSPYREHLENHIYDTVGPAADRVCIWIAL